VAGVDSAGDVVVDKAGDYVTRDPIKWCHIASKISQ
jgi:hypothetical protein